MVQDTEFDENAHPPELDALGTNVYLRPAFRRLASSKPYQSQLASNNQHFS